MLQPQCTGDRLVKPCRAYCRAFHAGCGARLPDRLRPHFDCARFPDYFGTGSCTPEPGIFQSSVVNVFMGPDGSAKNYYCYVTLIPPALGI